MRACVRACVRACARDVNTNILLITERPITNGHQLPTTTTSATQHFLFLSAACGDRSVPAWFDKCDAGNQQVAHLAAVGALSVRLPHIPAPFSTCRSRHAILCTLCACFPRAWGKLLRTARSSQMGFSMQGDSSWVFVRLDCFCFCFPLGPFCFLFLFLFLR